MCDVKGPYVFVMPAECQRLAEIHEYEEKRKTSPDRNMTPRVNPRAVNMMREVMAAWDEMFGVVSDYMNKKHPEFEISSDLDDETRDELDRANMALKIRLDNEIYVAAFKMMVMKTDFPQNALIALHKIFQQHTAKRAAELSLKHGVEFRPTGEEGDREVDALLMNCDTMRSRMRAEFAQIEAFEAFEQMQK